jgi:hypothetical protein
MFAHLAGTSVTRDRTLDTSEPSCVTGSARIFFIPVIHSPLGAMVTWQHRSSPLGEARSGVEELVAVLELSSWGDRAQSHGTRGSAGAHPGREVRSGAEEHMSASELNSAKRRDPGPRDTWQHQSSTQQGGGVRGCGIRGGSGPHLYMEV